LKWYDLFVVFSVQALLLSILYF